MTKSAPLLGLCVLLTAGAGSALAQKGGGGSGGLNQTSAIFLNAGIPSFSAGIGSSSSATLTLADAGSAPLSINTITLSGPGASAYSVGGTCANGSVLQRSPANCLVQITFTPTVVATLNAVLTATFLNAPTLSVTLNGTGRQPGPVFVISAPAAGIDFGSTAVGTVAATSIGISNPGATGLFGTMTFVGPNAGDFAFGSAGTRIFNCPAHLQLGPPPINNACQLGLDFVATAAGVRVATLHFSTNDPANPVFDLPLTGVGTPGVVTAPPPIVSAFDFTDLWETAIEPAWSLGITHHKFTTDTLVAFWQTYDVDGRGIWFELKDGHWVDAFTYTGTIHQPLGPSYTAAYDPALVADLAVGTATLSFTDAANGTFSYTINGVSGSKTITRNPS